MRGPVDELDNPNVALDVEGEDDDARDDQRAQNRISPQRDLEQGATAQFGASASICFLELDPIPHRIALAKRRVTRSRIASATALLSIIGSSSGSP